MDTSVWASALATGFSVLFVPPLVIDVVVWVADRLGGSSEPFGLGRKLRQGLIWSLAWTVFGLAPALQWDPRGAAGMLPLFALTVVALALALYRLRHERGGPFSRLIWPSLEAVLVMVAYLAAAAMTTAAAAR